MRRLARTVPYAQSAVWTRRLAVTGAILSFAAVVLPRRGMDSWHAVWLLAGGLSLASCALLCAVVAAVVIWRTGWKGTGRTVAGFLLGVLILAYPAFLAGMAIRDRPAIEIVTDLETPPQFSRARPATMLADQLGWLLALPARSAEAEPVTTNQDPVQAYRTVLAVITQLRWRVLLAAAPTAKDPTGRVEAVTFSAVMRLPEYIAVRVARRDGQTRIDLRSSARVAGLPLVGQDPLRNVQAFSDAMDDQDAAD